MFEISVHDLIVVSKELYNEYLDENSDYKPRKHVFSDELIRRVNENCGFIFDKYNYEKLSETEK
ncbi:MAG: hypothetical protein FK734_11230 [Asgard group archaeon]|nr:hypothetical protein [Asgard group archaeon]